MVGPSQFYHLSARHIKHDVDRVGAAQIDAGTSVAPTSDRRDEAAPLRIPSQADKRIIVTGSNSGIGLVTALELARAGAEITAPARTHAKAEDVAAKRG
jgi:hypothetical protein